MDIVRVFLTIERTAELRVQFAQHHHIDGDIFHLCVCTDCETFRQWFLTTKIMADGAAQSTFEEFLVGGGLRDVLASITSGLRGDPTDIDDCGHCTHWHQAMKGDPLRYNDGELAMECCHCKAPAVSAL